MVCEVHVASGPSLLPARIQLTPCMCWSQVKLSVDHFNKDHKKGFQYLQAQRLMPLLAGSPAAEAALASTTNPALTAR